MIFFVVGDPKKEAWWILDEVKVKPKKSLGEVYSKTMSTVYVDECWIKSGRNSGFALDIV